LLQADFAMGTRELAPPLRCELPAYNKEAWEAE
jgi:hypothetical protein